MTWHENLYVSEKASHESIRQFGRMRKKFQFPAYMITLPANPDNLLDIMSAREIERNCGYREVVVVGIASGKKDAIELVRDIIWDTYNNTGGFNIREYMERKS